MRSGVGESPQDIWTAPRAATLIKCVNDEDKSMFGGAWKFADKLKEERVVHRPRCQVWIVTKTFCNNAPKRGEGSCELVDESGQEISGLAQIPVVPPAEKCASKVICFVKNRTN